MYRKRSLNAKKKAFFLEQARIDISAEDEIDLLRGINGIEFDLYPIFEVQNIKFTD